MNQQANMAPMNAPMNAAGGPVGMPMMGNARNQMQEDTHQQKLNTYIYEYLLKNRSWDLARAWWKSMPVDIRQQTKPSPGSRNVNGVDGMDADSKDDMDKRPDDLPIPNIPAAATDNSFLLDWWVQFWDIYCGQHNKGEPSPTTIQYLQHMRQLNNHRQNEQQRMLMNNMNFRQSMANGTMRVPNELQKQALRNNANMNPQQIAQFQQMQKQQMMQSQMQREGSQMGGQPGSSPGSADNAPSPSKRPRVDGQFNGQPVGQGRSQPMPGQQGGATANNAGDQGMLLQNGLNPQPFGQQFQGNPALQGKSLEAMQPGGVPQGSPMVTQGMSEGPGDLFAGNGTRMPGQPGGQQAQGNHALQDYQMQLMLLEQQNKKRLLMARQEQDNITSQPTGSAPMGQAPFAPAMSPSGSRAGPSPNPNDQIKRGTPKLGQGTLPGSPMPDGSMVPRSSPAPAGFDPNQMPPGMPPNYPYTQMNANPAMMRPPSSHPGQNFGAPLNPQLEQMARQGGRMPNGAAMWQGPPQMGGMQPNQGQQPPNMGTPQQRNANMPPPPAPQPQGEAGRTQPSSPAQQNAQPPTPSQTHKANPKKKKQAEAKKPPAKKGGATGATPASEAEPPTPTPATPSTPMHRDSFAQQQQQSQQQKNGANPAANAQQMPQPAANAPPVQQPNQMDPNAGNGPFGEIGGTDMNMDFGNLDGGDVLESFDFDSFLHTDDNGSNFPDFGFPMDMNGVDAGGETAV